MKKMKKIALFPYFTPGRKGFKNFRIDTTENER